jgi:hypothetical protein
MTTVRPMNVSEHILAILNETPGLSDRELTDRIKGSAAHPSQINQGCRLLESTGKLTRQPRLDGRIGNYPAGVMPTPVVGASNLRTGSSANGELSEDEVKAHLKRWLEADAWQAEVAWGNARGTDIVARRDGETWLIEAKGCGSRPEMRVNYFIAMLGEVLQRMSLPDARYSIALPDMVQFRRLWERLPALARQRTGITAIFVAADGTVDHVVHAPSSLEQK